MGTEPGKKFTRLIEDLQQNGPDYSVFYAIFLCETISKTLYPDRDSEKLDQQGLKFRPYEMYVYPPKDIRSINYDNGVIEFIINFMGLYGVNSVLPRCYHEQVAQQQDGRETGKVPLQNFYDIFNNRFYWLYYHAWKKYRYYLQLSLDPNNPTMQRVFSFIGQGPQYKKETGDINPFKLLQCSNVLSNRVRNKAGLLILLKEFFPQFDFKIKEFVPHMVKLAERPYLGKRYDETAFQLGGFSVIGKSMLDRMSRIRIEIGPIDFDAFLDFIPRGKCARLLRQLLSLYLNDGLEYDIKLIIKTEGIKCIPWNDPRLRLGSTIWLGRPKQKLAEVDYSFERFLRDE